VIVAITGATGFVGQALIDQALFEGFSVCALARRPQQPRKGVEWLIGNLEPGEHLHALVRQCEVVIHVAGAVSAVDAAGFEATNVSGTINLIQACLAEGVGRFIYVSSLAAREPALSTYGASKARAERLVMASGMNWCVVRPPAVYGPGDTDMLQMFRLARWGIMPMPPRQGRTSMLHVADLARLLLALVPSTEELTAKVFEPDDGRRHGWSNRELAKAIGRAVRRRPWVVHLNRSALSALAWFDRLLHRDQARLTPDRVGYMVHHDWVVRHEARPARRLWKPEVPTLEGLKATAEWYRQARWL